MPTMNDSGKIDAGPALGDFVAVPNITAGSAQAVTEHRNNYATVTGRSGTWK